MATTLSTTSWPDTLRDSQAGAKWVHRPTPKVVETKRERSGAVLFLHSFLATVFAGVVLFLAGYARTIVLVRRQKSEALLMQAKTSAVRQLPLFGKQAIEVPRAAPTPAVRLNPQASLQRAWSLAHGVAGSHDVLFTFDDGPNPGTTDKLLEVLDRHHVKGIFFVVGEALERRGQSETASRELLRTIVARGHMVGNHSMNHPQMSQLSAARVAWQVDRTDALIEEITGQAPSLFRPPYGDYGVRVRKHLVAREKDLWVWSIDSRDWEHVNDAQTTAQLVIDQLQRNGGGTVLMHDTHAWSVDALEIVLQWIETRNAELSKQHRPTFNIVTGQQFFASLAAAHKS